MLFIYLQNMIYSQVIFFCNKQNDCRIGMYCNTLSECDYCDNIKKYKNLIAKDNFGAGLLIRYKCPNCEVIFGDLRFLNLSKEAAEGLNIT